MTRTKTRIEHLGFGHREEHTSTRDLEVANEHGAVMEFVDRFRDKHADDPHDPPNGQQIQADDFVDVSMLNFHRHMRAVEKPRFTGSGRVVTVSISVSVPLLAFQSKAVTVQAISLITYA